MRKLGKVILLNPLPLDISVRTVNRYMYTSVVADLSVSPFSIGPPFKGNNLLVKDHTHFRAATLRRAK